MALAFAGKAVASSAISVIVRKSFDYLEKYTKLEGMKSVQERLERTLPHVEIVFDAIDMEKIRGQSEALDAWLWQLREAEDVLDEVEYYKLEKKVETSGNNVSRFLYKWKRMFIQQFNATFNVGTFKKMVDAMKKLDEVAAALERVHPFVDRIDPSSSMHISQQETSDSPETSSFLLDEMIIGRETEKDQIVEWLVKQESDDHQSIQACSFTTLALVGIGGMGKTTLVTAVYHDQRVKQCFDQVMWVCVSKEFNVQGLTKKIVQEATGKGTKVTGLNTLQEILREQLRTLFIYFDKTADGRVQWHVLKNVLKVATKLRVLRVHQVMSLLVNLPKEFDNLMHLRCLFGLWTGVRCPSSIYKLYHLEMVRLKGCLWDSSRLGNLINLRRLDYSGIQTGPPPHIGHLTSLQYLKVDLKYERMSEIRDLNDLRCLHIAGIQNCNVEDSKLAKLAEKKNLTKLSLSWDNSTCESGTEELLLDNLQPHTSLSELKVEGYSGMRSPCWMGHPVISNLVYIYIYKCRNWQNLPALGSLPALRYLHLISMYAVKRIDHSFYGCEDSPGFPSLELLFLHNLPALEEWVEMEGRNVFPQLKTLSIEDCRALRSIPVLPSILTNIKIEQVGLDTFPAIFQSSETPLSQKPLLSSLKISNCPNLVTFTRDREYCFRSLEELCIENCENLLHFPVDRLQTLQFLATFSVVNCPKLMAPHADVSLPSSVRKLHIRSCGVYETCLLNSLCCLTSLTTLHLQDCVMTAPTPDDISVPLSIRNLYIRSVGVYENRLLNSMCSLSSLDTLSLSNCVITAFPSAQVFRSLSTLRCLEIANCSELASLDWIEELTSLAGLIVIDCDKLIGTPSQQMLQTSDLSQVAAVGPSHMGKLRRLRISDPFLLQCEPLRRVNSVRNLTIDKSWNRLPEEWLMQNCNRLKTLGVLDASQLEFLPSTVAKLSSLEILEFQRAKLIQSLPELPASLRELKFLGSHPVLIRRCQKNKGHDWHKIAHIREFRIEQDFSGSYKWSSFQSLRWSHA